MIILLFMVVRLEEHGFKVYERDVLPDTAWLFRNCIVQLSFIYFRVLNAQFWQNVKAKYIQYTVFMLENHTQEYSAVRVYIYMW